MGSFEQLTHSTNMVVFYVGTGSLGTMNVCSKCPDNRVNIAQIFQSGPNAINMDKKYVLFIHVNGITVLPLCEETLTIPTILH